MNNVVLEVRNLRTYFHTDEGVIPAVDGVDFTLKKGKTLCIVGESGCGKSVTAFTIMRLIPMPPGKVESGEILYSGKNLIKLTENEMREIRGNEIAMIFQEPMTSLNPVYTIGNQIMEAIVLHQKVRPGEARQRAIKILEKVGLPEAQKRVDEYPHQMSGGMKQRVMIAMALSCNPEVLIADEPTTALDVTIQAQILDLLKHLQETEGLSILLITHDLAVVSEVADEVLVMYASKVVENAGVNEIFNKPKHPYTQGLIKAIPQLGNRVDRLNEIPGQVPRPQNYPEGCHFSDRCPHVMDICHKKDPGMTKVGADHLVSCFLYEGEL